MNPLHWLLSNQLKRTKQKKELGGFTLIELLVAMILAALIITPLLGFMINVLDNDRKEQAKVNTEQDINTALEYIKRDLQESVYIYDADGIQAIRQHLPKNSERTTHFPVLVFWKRQFIDDGLVLDSNNSDDTFVYSLVAYYVIKDNSSTWSKAARIGRFQISNGYGINDTQKNATRDRGFQLFNLRNTGDLKSKMSKWQPRSGETFNKDIVPLVDFIDHTPITAATGTNPSPTCPAATGTNPAMQLIPRFVGTGDAVPTTDMSMRGFYVCVDSTNTVVEVNLRGNALARIQNTNNNFNNNNTSYFPQANIRVQGRGFVFTK